MTPKLPECQDCPLLLALMPTVIAQRFPCARDFCASLWATAFLPSNVRPSC